MQKIQQIPKVFKARRTVTFILTLTLVGVLSIIFLDTWNDSYNAIIVQPLYRRGIWLIVAIYAVIVYLFMKLYGGFKVGHYKVSQIIYSQVLSVIFANFITYLQMSLLARGFLPLEPVMFMTFLDIMAITVWTVISDRIYYYIYPPRKLLIVYGSESVEELLKKLLTRKDRYKVCESISIDEDYEDIIYKIGQYQAVVLSYIKSGKRNQLLKYCFENNIRTYITPKISDIIIRGANDIDIFDTPLLLCKNYGLSVEQRISKRLLDLFIASVGIIITSPIMIITAVAIKLYDKGPVLFKQERMTENGKEFYVYKFRSMIVDAEKDGKAILSTKKDGRITPVGKIIRATRVDELPQFFNIFLGDMSVVGPRPERPEIANDYQKDLPEFALRLKVKAGLTGYAQVYGKYNTLPYDKLKMDLMYIEQYSFLLDIKIILTTIKILFVKESTEGFEKTLVFSKEDMDKMKKQSSEE